MRFYTHSCNKKNNMLFSEVWDAQEVLDEYGRATGYKEVGQRRYSKQVPQHKVTQEDTVFLTTFTA